MALVPVLHARVSDDGMTFSWFDNEREARRKHTRTFAGKVVEIIIRKPRDTRSLRANNYYWSCVLEVMSKEHSEGDQSAEEIHDAMCQMFLPDEVKRVEFFNRMTGEVLSVDTDPRRTSKLKGDEFYTFVEKVRKFALEFMGIRTEDPDPEYWRKRKQVAA